MSPPAEPLTDPALLARLLRRPVVGVETESAPMIGLVRVTALRLDGGTRFELPVGNALRTAGDVAEVRALLEGWPRVVASAVKARLGHGDPLEERAATDAVLARLAEDPDAALAEVGGPGSR